MFDPTNMLMWVFMFAVGFMYGRASQHALIQRLRNWNKDE